MKRTPHNNGFTIVELLTVMAVIALLIGLLVPALSMVKDRAKDIQQRAQFHAISSGLEMFKADFGDYPESNDNSINSASSPQKIGDNRTYCGANKLAEAMVGLDYLGFHPSSDFRLDGANTIINKLGQQIVNQAVYHANLDVANWETAEENIQARKGPYVDLENANAFRMDEVYTTIGAPFVVGWDNKYPLVMCDVYSKKRGGTGGKKTGTPILYFKARTNNSRQDSVTSQNMADPNSTLERSIYYYYDNNSILSLGLPDTGVAHEILRVPADTLLNFDNLIINKNVQMVPRPYRANSYILWSAGKDGSFGTGDDVFNFTKEAE